MKDKIMIEEYVNDLAKQMGIPVSSVSTVNGVRLGVFA